MGLGGTLLAGIPLIGNAIPTDQPWHTIDTKEKLVAAGFLDNLAVCITARQLCFIR